MDYQCWYALVGVFSLSHGLAKAYLATIGNSIADFLRYVRNKEWNLYDNDGKAFEIFEERIRRFCGGDHSAIDFLVEELSSGSAVTDARSRACEMLGRRCGSVSAPDLVAHMHRCPLILAEKKDPETSRFRTLPKARAQVESLYYLCRDLREQALLHDWFKAVATSQNAAGGPWDDQFSHHGGIALIHLSKIPSEVKKKRLVEGVLVKRRPKRKREHVILWRNPYIVVVSELKPTLAAQASLA